MKKLKMEDKIPFKSKVFDNLPEDYTESIFSGQIRDAPLISILIKSDERQLHFPIQKDLANFFPRDDKRRQLKPDDFEITNLTNWNSFIGTILLAIKEEMEIEPSFSASVNNLHLGASGSCLEDSSQKVPGTFATLVIQLPSKYRGGQLVFKYDEMTDTIDYSNNELASFYTFFYNDRKPEFLSITEGVRVCLVYDLITTDISIPRAPRISYQELVTLFKSWNYYEPVKLVYVFYHTYTRKNLTRKDLKMRDKAVVNLFKRLSLHYPLTVYLGFLKIKADSDKNLLSNHVRENLRSAESYLLTNLVSLKDNAPFEYENSITVDFEDQIIPVKSLEEFKPYKKRIGKSVTNYFRVPAMAIWPDINLLRVLRNGGADSGTIANIFLGENGKKEGDKLLNWAKTIASMSPRVRTNKFESSYVTYPGEIDASNVIPLLTAMINFNDVTLLQNFLNHHTTLTDEVISLIRSQCDIFGWRTLTIQVQNMFKRETNTSKSVQFLEMLVGNDDKMVDGKKFLCQSLAKIILENTPYYKLESYGYEIENENPDELEREQKILRTMLITCQKLDCAIIATQFAKRKPLTIIVPVLLKLASENSILDEVLINFCIAEIEESVSDEDIINSWRCADLCDCDCIDCKKLNRFLRSNLPKVKLDPQLKQHFKPMLDNKLTRKGKKRYFCGDGLTIRKMFRTDMTLIEVLRLETHPEDPLEKLKAFV